MGGDGALQPILDVCTRYPILQRLFGSFISTTTVYLSVIIPFQFRWSSAYEMVERAIKIRKGLDEVAMAKDLRHVELSNDEWDQIEEVMAFLQPFAEATNDMEGSSYPTLNMVLPLYNLLIDHVMDWEGEKEDGAE